MKIQDIGFLVVLALVVLRGSVRASVVVGLLCLAFSTALFAMWIFFTAQRFTYYAAAFFLFAILIKLLRAKGKS